MLRRQTVGQGQAVVHLLPEQGSAIRADGVGAVMQIPAQVAEGLTDPQPVVCREIGGFRAHGQAPGAGNASRSSSRRVVAGIASP